MKLDKKDMRLYAVTDRTWLKGRELAADVEKAILGGATFVQLREKQVDQENFLAQARAVRSVCKKHHVPFVINDDVDIALAVDADGVHVGQSDMEAGDVRARLGGNKIIGVSVKNVEQALLAQTHGADYLGVGAMFATATKSDAWEITMEELGKICATVNIPVVAIGGIGLHNVEKLAGTGIDGVAVVSALFAAEDVEKAARDMMGKLKEIVR